MRTDAAELRAGAAERNKGDRDFTYIRPSGRRLSEYEAVNMYVQVEQGLMGSDGWFVLRADGRTPWCTDSTKLRHPHWFDFRDPAKLWQRVYTRNQAEQERAIERVTEETILRGALADIDKDWLELVIRQHYRVWSFVEYGTFRPWATAQREALSDTLGSVCVFEGLDRLRHAQDIVIWLMELEMQLPGFQDEGGKERWVTEPCYQPTRRLIERLMHDQFDWGELAVATNLVIDPILTEVAVFQLIGRNGSLHGDVVTPFIVSTAQRDRRWSLAWTEALVKMVTEESVPAAKANKELIEDWVCTWTPLALDAAGALAEVYDKVPFKQAPFEQVLAGAQAAQRRILDGLGLLAGGVA
jgi:hypothetical protein